MPFLVTNRLGHKYCRKAVWLVQTIEKRAQHHCLPCEQHQAGSLKSIMLNFMTRQHNACKNRALEASFCLLHI